MTDFSMIRGDTKTLTVTLTNSNGSPLDLTDKTLTFTATRWGYSTGIVKTEGDGIEVTSALDGICEITIDPADTADLEPDYWGGYSLLSYTWDFQVENEAGEVRTPLRGRLKVYPDMTRATA